MSVVCKYSLSLKALKNKVSKTKVSKNKEYKKASNFTDFYQTLIFIFITLNIHIELLKYTENVYYCCY